MDKTKGFALYQHREKIMRLRMKAMEAAAKAKSRDSADEEYRIAKSKYSCLTILKDQLDVLSKDITLSASDRLKFSEARTKLDSELEKAKQNLNKKTPSSLQSWERKNGLDDAAIKRGLPAKKRRNPNTTLTNEKINSMMGVLDREKEKSEYNTGIPITKHALKFVLRDENGQPLDDNEIKKQDWNREWLSAVQKADKTDRNRMLKESYGKLLRWELPSPQQIESKGIESFFLKDPAFFYEMANISRTFEQYRNSDGFVRKYCRDNPGFVNKAEMVKQLWSMLEKRADKAGVQAVLRQYAGNYQREQSDLNSSQKNEMKNAELHTDTITDMKDLVKENISELRKEKQAKRQTINPALAELERNMNEFQSILDLKISFEEPEGAEQGFDQIILKVQTLYNTISDNAQKCMEKKSIYGGLRHGKLMLQKLKIQAQKRADHRPEGRYDESGGRIFLQQTGKSTPYCK